MKILSIGNDRDIFNQGSEVRRRAIDYGKLVEELHIIVFAKKGIGKKEQLASNVWLYPTNSPNRWFYIWNAIGLGRKMNGSFNLVTGQDPYETGFVGLRLARFYKCVLQLQIHVDIFSPHFRRESLGARLRTLLSKITLRYANCIRVVGSRVALSIRKYTKAKITILPIFVDASQINKDPGTEVKRKYSGKKIILMVSRLATEKNIPLAVKVMSLLLQKYSNAVLLIAGEGSERPVIEEKIRKSGLQNNVILLGQVRYSELAKYYGSADVFLHTSNYEGYGLALVEASIVELPIVTTNVGIAGDIKGAKIVDVGDKKALVEVLSRELENPQKTKPFNVGSYSDYLEQIKRSWETCV